MKSENLKKVIILSIIALSVVFTTVTVFAQEKTGSETDVAVVQETNNAAKMGGLIGAAIAFGFGAIGAGIAIANVGSAAMGAVAEKPQLAGQALIFIALAEGIVVFGFITALMILGKI